MPIDLQAVRQAVAIVDVDGSAARPSDGYLASSEIKEAVSRLEFAIRMGEGADQTVPKQQRAALLSFLPLALAAEAAGDRRGAPYMKNDFYKLGLEHATLRAAVFVDAVSGDNDGMVSPARSVGVTRGHRGFLLAGLAVAAMGGCSCVPGSRSAVVSLPSAKESSAARPAPPEPVAAVLRLWDAHGLIHQWPGYVLTCQTTPQVMSVGANGVRRRVNLSIPAGDGGYFLDGVYVYGSGGRSLGCDAVFCTQNYDSHIRFVEYQQVGERPPPKDAHLQFMTNEGLLSEVGKVAEFRTAPLTGNVEVQLDYFADPNCRVPRRFSKVVTVAPL